MLSIYLVNCSYFRWSFVDFCFNFPLIDVTLDVKCPVCEVMIPHDDIDRHLVMCLTRPRIQYNGMFPPFHSSHCRFASLCQVSTPLFPPTDETLIENKGECVICLEDMEEGHVIARLPCLCIYHKTYVSRISMVYPWTLDRKMPDFTLPSLL